MKKMPTSSCVSRADKILFRVARRLLK